MDEQYESQERIPNLHDSGLPNIVLLLIAGATVTAAVIAAVIGIHFLAGHVQTNWVWTAWI